MTKSNTWILIMDSKHALFYSKDRDGYLTREHALSPIVHSHENTNTKNSLGRSFDSSGGARHIIEPHIDPHTKEQMEFVATACHYLEKSMMNHLYHKLILIAPPKILGLLRQTLDKQVREIVIKELDKEIAHLDEAQIKLALEKEGIIH